MSRLSSAGQSLAAPRGSPRCDVRSSYPPSWCYASFPPPPRGWNSLPGSTAQIGWACQLFRDQSTALQEQYIQYGPLATSISNSRPHRCLFGIAEIAVANPKPTEQRRGCPCAADEIGCPGTIVDNVWARTYRHLYRPSSSVIVQTGSNFKKPYWRTMRSRSDPDVGLCQLRSRVILDCWSARLVRPNWVDLLDQVG